MQAVQSLMNTAVAPDVEPQGTAALEASAAAAGVLALPVLAWSLFTLKTTGVLSYFLPMKICIMQQISGFQRSVTGKENASAGNLSWTLISTSSETRAWPHDAHPVPHAVV